MTVTHDDAEGPDPLDPDRSWALRAARGEVDSPGALGYARWLNVLGVDRVRERDPELAAALEVGNSAYPDDDRRRPGPDDVPPPVEVDPEATDAFVRLVGDDGEGAGPRRPRRRRSTTGARLDGGQVRALRDPGPRLPVTRGPWCYSTGEGPWPRAVYTLTRAGGGADPTWEPIAPLPYVRARLTRRTARGGHEFVLSATPEGPAVLVDGEALRDGTWAQRLDLVLSDDDRVMRAASTAIRAAAEGAPQPERGARWEGDRLVPPPVEALPAGYLAAEGDEAAARVAWAEVGALACQPGAENLALCLGAAYAAPYVAALSRVRPVSFALVGVGAPRRGKTTNANAAAGWWGSPILVNPVLSESAIALGDTLADLGCLPLFRDEAHAASWRPHQWREYFMRALNGAGRRRSSSTGSGAVHASGHWWGVQFLTGNVDPRYGATDGVQARVVVLSDPHLPDRRTARRVTELLGEAYGWPARWQLADHPAPARFAELVEAARDRLPADVEGSADTVAESLALCVAGAELAGELIGAPELAAAATSAALRTLGTLADTMADAPASFGARLLDDVWADVQAHPGLYPTRRAYDSMMSGDFPGVVPRELRGFLWDEYRGRPAVSLTRVAFNELAGPADYATGEALAELRSRGQLVTDKKGFQHLVRPLTGGRRRSHFFTFLAPPDPDEAPPAPPPPPELPLPAASSPAEPAPAAEVPASGAVSPPERPEAPEVAEDPAERPAASGRPPGRRSGVRGAAASSTPAATVVVVDGGRLAVLRPVEGARLEYGWDFTAGEAPGKLAEVAAAAAALAPEAPVSLVVSRADHKRLGLPAEPPGSRSRLPATLHAAGWHQPGQPGQPPYPGRYLWLAREGRPHPVLVYPHRWQLADDFPRVAGEPDGPLDLGERLAVFGEATGCDLAGSAAATGVKMLRAHVEATARRVPYWHPPGSRSWPEPTPAGGRWAGELPEGATHVHSWDAARCHLGAIRQAVLAVDALRHHDWPTFDPRQAGYWLVRVPEWPWPEVPAPVLVEPGREAWVTTAVVGLYVELGLEPEAIPEAWTARAVDLAGRRHFAAHLSRVLADPELPADVAVGVKRTYQAVHGKVRSVDQSRIGRRDWGHAIADAAACTMLRKLYQGAGRLPLPQKVTGGDHRYTSTPVAPLEVRDVDTVVYAGGPEAAPPESFTVGERLGDFRHSGTSPAADWPKGA